MVLYSVLLLNEHAKHTNSEVQIILLGESGVGKTSLLLRFISGLFREILPRTAIDSKKKVIKIKDVEVNLVVWDTAGQEMYNSLVRGYYRLADGVILVYDAQNADTFLKLSKWLVDLKTFNERAQVLIAGTKSEDQSKKSVNISMVKHFALAEGIEHVEVSSKSGANVKFLFRHLVTKILSAKGILTFSKSCVLERLVKTGEFIAPSSITSEHSSSKEAQEKSDTDKISSTVSQASKELKVALENDFQSLNIIDKPTITVNQLEEQRVKEKQNEEADIKFVENADSDTQSVESTDSDTQFVECADSDTESAECALQFFETFPLETDIFAVAPERRDVIKLAETEVRNNKRTFCVI